MTSSAPPTPTDNLRLRGAGWDVLHRQAAEILLSGPAGTGKSLACLFKVHAVAATVPGARVLVCRRTRKSVTDSALVTFERDILARAGLRLGRARREGRHSYPYPNGSEIVLGGMDQPSRIMSTDFDLVYVQEATELDEAGWEALTTRLRNGRLPFQQLIADCNPDSPRHWLKRRCDAGRCLLLESRHEDNPRLWDGRVWTAEGAAYLAKLDALTGPRLLRLRHGRWVQAEGVVYDGYDPAVHLLDRFDVPGSWPRVWSVDFGYTNPFVWQDWALDPDGRLYLVREIYHTRRLVEDHAKRIRKLTGGQAPPAAVVCDHDAEGRATLERYLGVETVPAVKEIRAGIQGVAARLRKAGDGRPRLYLLRDALDERDPELADRKLPASTEEEFDSYLWDAKSVKDVPLDRDNHGMDAMRYAVWGLDCGPAAEEDETPEVVRV